jgi:hypothetical protein
MQSTTVTRVGAGLAVSAEMYARPLSFNQRAKVFFDD